MTSPPKSVRIDLLNEIGRLVDPRVHTASPGHDEAGDSVLSWRWELGQDYKNNRCLTIYVQDDKYYMLRSWGSTFNEMSNRTFVDLYEACEGFMWLVGKREN